MHQRCEVKSEIIMQVLDQVAEEQDFCGITEFVSSVENRLCADGVEVEQKEILDVYNNLFMEDV